MFALQLESTGRGQYVCLEDELCADGERQHGKLVQLCEGSEG